MRILKFGLVLPLTPAACALALAACSCAVGASQQRSETVATMSAAATTGRSLFQKNCAHCHGDDARGDEGPDLHGLDHKDEWFATRIRKGIKGEMPAFGEKFKQEDIDNLIVFLRALK